MDRVFLGYSLGEWLASASAFVLVAFGVPIIRAVLRRRCPIGVPGDRSWRTLVGRLNASWMRLTTLVIAAVCASIPFAGVPRVHDIARIALIVAVAVQFLRLTPVLVDWLLLVLSSKSKSPEDERATSANLAGLRWLIVFVVYSLILLLALQNAGIEVTSLIAGLGIGGIAVALALQNVLSDLFGSLTIILDKPFVVGDFIVVGSEMGTVENIGLKTTRVRSLSGEQLVFGNTDLLASRIRNFKRMSERRVVLSFGVVYDTSADQLESINAIVRGAITDQSDVRFDRCHFYRFGASSLDFEAVYYINSPDYNAHMDAQQAVLFAITRAFASGSIKFAFPTQTLYIVSGESTPSSAQRTTPAHTSEMAST